MAPRVGAPFDVHPTLFLSKMSNKQVIFLLRHRFSIDDVFLCDDKIFTK